MKILITTDWYKPVINGVVTSVLNLVDGLEKEGHDVRILTLSKNRHNFKDGKVYYIGSLPAGKVYPNARVAARRSRRLISELEEWNPDVIHSQCEFSSYIFARIISHHCDCPIVHTYHTVYEDYTNYFHMSKRVGRRASKTFTRRLVGRLDAVIAPTDKIKDLLTKYRIKAPIYTVPTGLNLDKFKDNYSVEIKNELKKNLGISSSDFVLLFLGRLAKEKNVSEILRYIKDLNIDNLKLLLVGDGPYRQKLEDEVDRLGLREKVVFAGMVKPNEIGLYYSLGDIFVSASQSEAQGLTYIEAMAAGLPILCHYDRCLDGIVHQGETGYTYKTAQEFNAILQHLMNDSQFRASIGKNAKDLVEREYSKESFAKKAVEVYKSVL